MKRYTFLIQPIFPKKPKKPKKITCKMVKTIASVESHLDISPSIVSPLLSQQSTTHSVPCHLLPSVQCMQCCEVYQYCAAFLGCCTAPLGRFSL